MRKFDLEFEVHQTFTYLVFGVEAETPEEAIRLFKEDPEKYSDQQEENGLQESWDDLETTTAVGERVPSPSGGNHQIPLKESYE
jgi:hypothetical protein